MNDQPGDSPLPLNGGQDTTTSSSDGGILSRINPFRKKSTIDTRVRDTIEELLEEREEYEVPLGPEETRLLKNVFGLRERTIEDVCVPRSDICAVPVDASLEEVMALMTKEGHSRLPVYGEDLDDPLGMVHIKDVLAWQNSPAPFNLAKICRRILFASPSARVLELLLEMRTKRVHMALMVDEYGGTDGLVSIEDLVEEIVGEIEDEHDRPEGPMYVGRADGNIDVDARWELEDCEEKIGEFLDEEEREDIDTIGGLVFSLAGRVPVRGEIVTHEKSGLEFEILEADARRVYRVRIRNLSALSSEEVTTT